MRVDPGFPTPRDRNRSTWATTPGRSLSSTSRPWSSPSVLLACPAHWLETHPPSALFIGRDQLIAGIDCSTGIGIRTFMTVVTYAIRLGRIDLLLRFVLRFFHCFSFWSLENRFTRAARTTPWMPGCWSRYPRGTRKQRWHVSRRPACASCAFSPPGCAPSQSSGPS
jgi:hypothetical protein